MNRYKDVECWLQEAPQPDFKKNPSPVILTDETMEWRRRKVLHRMSEEHLDVLIVYADLEHGSNFEYLTGFLPRFEEAILVLHQDGTAYLLLGNENTKMVRYSRIPAELIHVPFFSLPNQPMTGEREMAEYFREAGLCEGQKVGLVGWKMFTSKGMDNKHLFELPYYVVETIKACVGMGQIRNSCHLFIGEHGARTMNNANEIAHYEFGSALASTCILQALNQVQQGITELELGSYLNAYGQRNSVVTIAATGERFEYANFYPTEKRVALGDKMSLTVGYKGGLSSRAGYAVESAAQLPEEGKDYIERLAAPYYKAVVAWLENIRIGMSGDELYELIKVVLPPETYHWSLNPGHLTADEEWMSSPVYPGSRERLTSGMMLQTDIIPGIPGYAGVSCESGIALADKTLKEELMLTYPQLYEVFGKRRKYMEEILNIRLSEDVLLMNDTVAYYRPFFMNRELAFVKRG